MDKFIITGGKKLSGSVRIVGSKNAVLPIMTAALLIEKGTTVIKGVPNLADVHTAVDVLTHLGAHCDFDPQARRLTINAENVDRHDVPYDLMRRMRASFLVLGALIRGDTDHYQHLAAEVTKGVAQLSIQSNVPVSYGVLTCDNLEQALHRAGSKAGNKGADAMISLIEMVNLKEAVDNPPEQDAKP